MCRGVRRAADAVLGGPRPHDSPVHVWQAGVAKAPRIGPQPIGTASGYRRGKCVCVCVCVAWAFCTLVPGLL